MTSSDILSTLQIYNIEIDYKTSCWNYVGKQKSRYPRVSYGKTKFQLHRLSWFLTFGEIPDGLYVCHKCDNTKCCNPDHLFLGTQFDNMQDMVNKGRNKDTSGSNNGRAKLSWKIVDEIRKAYSEGVHISDISKLYNLPMSTVSNVTRNKTWIDPYYKVPTNVLHKNKSITSEIVNKVISLKGLTQMRIAGIVGISQAEVSRILIKNGSTE